MHGEYKGETPSKVISRGLVWRQHHRLLGAPTFKTSPHVFLASRVAGDVPVLRAMGVRPINIWAVEKERSEVECLYEGQTLYERQTKEGFRLLTQDVEIVVRNTVKHHSIYLDTCGTFPGMRGMIGRVVPELPNETSLSITLFLGREQEKIEDGRETALLHHIQNHTEHRVTLVQRVLYLSAVPGDTHHGSPMGTWTFYLGHLTSRSKMRFDLRGDKNMSMTDIDTLWRDQVRISENRSKGAVLANITRR